jgi:hypothetical protein
MFGQTPLPNVKPSLHLQLETDRSVLSEDVASPSNSRFLWTGFGFAVLMLIGILACALFPPVAYASAKRSRHSPALAFIPSLPALASGGMRPAIKNIGNKDQKMTLIGGQRDLGKMSGNLRRSSQVMSSVFDRRGSNSAVLESPVSKLELQFAGPPAPPPPSPPTTPPPGDGSGDGSSGAGGGVVLKRFSESEAVTILDAWIMHAKVYCLEGQFGDPEGLVPMHRANLQQLESFRSFALSSPSAADEKILYGLYDLADQDKALAIAGGQYSSSDGEPFLSPSADNPPPIPTQFELPTGGESEFEQAGTSTRQALPQICLSRFDVVEI